MAQYEDTGVRHGEIDLREATHHDGKVLSNTLKRDIESRRDIKSKREIDPIELTRSLDDPHPGDWIPSFSDEGCCVKSYHGREYHFFRIIPEDGCVGLQVGVHAYRPDNKELVFLGLEGTSEYDESLKKLKERAKKEEEVQERHKPQTLTDAILDQSPVPLRFKNRRAQEYRTQY